MQFVKKYDADKQLFPYHIYPPSFPVTTPQPSPVPKKTQQQPSSSADQYPTASPIRWFVDLCYARYKKVAVPGFSQLRSASETNGQSSFLMEIALPCRHLFQLPVTLEDSEWISLNSKQQKDNSFHGIIQSSSEKQYHFYCFTWEEGCEEEEKNIFYAVDLQCKKIAHIPPIKNENIDLFLFHIPYFAVTSYVAESDFLKQQQISAKAYEDFAYIICVTRKEFDEIVSKRIAEDSSSTITSKIETAHFKLCRRGRQNTIRTAIPADFLVTDFLSQRKGTLWIL